MNIKKYIFAKSVAFLGFFLLATLSSNSAIIAISDQTAFETARDNAEWNGRLRMASSGDEFGIATGGTIAPLTDDYENWRVYGSFLQDETLTMPFSISATGTSITFSFGDVNSSTHGLFAGSATTSLTNVLGLSPYSTLWIGLESKLPGNTFSIINTSLNGDGIIDTSAIGQSFAGFQTSVGNSWTLTGEFQTIHTPFSPTYSGSDAGFYVFGDNTAVVPEPSSVLLIALSGFSLILRRKR